MAQRIRIALIFQVKKSWMGGTCYVLNIINALNTLPDYNKPHVLLLCTNYKDFEFAQKNTNYPYLEYRDTFKPSLRQQFARIINKIGRTFLGKNVMFPVVFNEEVDVIYPVMNQFQLRAKNRKIFWIPDFQEHYLPHLFSPKQIRSRDHTVNEIIEVQGHIVFSSEDSLKSFIEFYPKGLNLKKSVFHFVSSIPTNIYDAKSIIAARYQLPHKYFFCANQFWSHKNHMVLFEAIRLLKIRGVEVTVVCTGGTRDYRNLEYFPSLINFIEENNLNQNIRLLGFIDRKDQLALIQECSAIIQPSLFEGWSTSIEEAKAMNKFLILSDLPLHKEQVKHNCWFFERSNPTDLAMCIERFLKEEPKLIVIDYYQDIIKAAKTFIDIIHTSI